MFRRVVVVAILLAAGSVARADVTAVGVARVHRSDRCASAACSPSDPTVPTDGLVDGTIQIHIEAASDIALQWVRLDARPAGGRWLCLQRWTPNTPSFTGYYEWATASWPPIQSSWGCDESFEHKHGEPTANLAYTFRVVATDISGDTRTSQGSHRIRLDNAPATPIWESGVSSDGGVTARWFASREPDLDAYALTRAGPDGTRRFMIRPDDLAGAGCRAEEAGTNIVIIGCSGTVYAATTRTGTYRFTLSAYRPGARATLSCPGGSGGRCFVSPASEARTLRLRASAPSASMSPTLAATPGPSASASATARARTTAPRSLSSGSATTHPVAAGAPAPPPPARTPLLFIAALLVGLAGGSVHWTIRPPRARRH